MSADVDAARVISRAQSVAAARLRALHVPDPEREAGELITALMAAGLRPVPALLPPPRPQPAPGDSPGRQAFRKAKQQLAARRKP